MQTTDANAIRLPALKFSDDDAGPLMIDRLRQSWNRMSPFADRLAAYTPGTGGTGQEPAQHPLLAEIGSILACPDVRISYRTGDTKSAFAAYCRRNRGEQVVVVFPFEENTHLVYRFETISEYLAWWVHAVSAADDSAADDAAYLTVPLPVLTYWLHAVDMYRRAYYQRLQSYGASRQEFVTVTQFTDAMAQSVASHDPHWLLPAFLLLTPGLHAQQLAPQPAHLKLLAERGYLLPAKEAASEQPVFLFGDALAAAGKQFLNGVDSAIGIEIAVWTERGTLPVYEAFLAPSNTADHLIEVERDEHGMPIGRYQALSQRQLYARQIGMLSAALHPDAARIALARAAPTLVPKQEQASPPAEIVCPACGKANPASMKFCGHCGGRLIPAENLSLPIAQADVNASEALAQAPENESERSYSRQGPTVTAREWFRKLQFLPNVHFRFRRHPSDQQRIMAVECRGRQPAEVPIARELVEDLARQLRIFRDRKVFSDDDFKALHAALRVRDHYGALWTVGLNSLRWNRMEHGRWVPAPAPESVSLDMSMLQQIIGNIPMRTHIPPIAVADAPAMPAPSCRNCGKPLRPGAKFCTACGAKVNAATAPAPTAQQTCTKCGNPLRPGAKFCNACGAELAAVAVVPAKRAATSVELPEQALKTMLARVHFAMAHNETGTREVFNGLLMTIEARELCALTTDGHRLAQATHPLDNPQSAAQEFVLRADTVNELLDTLADRRDPVAIDLASSRVRFRFGAKEVSADLFDRVFPNVRRIIPANQPNVLRVVRQTLIEALRRSGGAENNGAVYWALEPGRLTLNSAANQQGPQETLNAEYRGESLRIAFNARYWLDALTALDCDAVELAFGNEMSAAALTIPGRQDYKYVVMPMRI